MSGEILVEACVDSVESALAAQQGGADRVELCDNLVEGGTTPSAGMIELCRERLHIPLFVIIRPRGGDFLYGEAEFEVMRRDIVRAGELGASGVVLGILGPDGTVDVARTRCLVEQARPMSVTFHRAFDVTRDPDEALDSLLDLGIDRVLTSGRAATALEGIPTISRLVERSVGRVGILAGGGVREENVTRIVRESGVTEVHVRLTRTVPSGMVYRNAQVTFGGGTAPSDEVRLSTSASRISRLREVVRGMTANPQPGI